jgi:hypothetical protein
VATGDFTVIDGGPTEDGKRGANVVDIGSRTARNRNGASEIRDLPTSMNYVAEPWMFTRMYHSLAIRLAWVMFSGKTVAQSEVARVKIERIPNAANERFNA